MKMVKPEMEIIEFLNDDIIVTSGECHGHCHGHCVEVCPTDCIEVCREKCYTVTGG